MDSLRDLCNGVLDGWLVEAGGTKPSSKNGVPMRWWVPAMVFGGIVGRAVSIQLDGRGVLTEVEGGFVVPEARWNGWLRRSGGVYDLRVEGGWRERVKMTRVDLCEKTYRPVGVVLEAAPPHLQVETWCGVAVCGMDRCPAVQNGTSTMKLHRYELKVRTPAFTRPPTTLFADVAGKSDDDTVRVYELLCDAPGVQPVEVQPTAKIVSLQSSTPSSPEDGLEENYEDHSRRSTT